jgi:hypothetical protein
MYFLEKMMLVAYICSLITGSYLAITTLRGVYSEGRRLERLSTISLDDEQHKVLVFDAIEPAAGK